MVDVAIAGGGLSGGLIALALHRARTGLRVALVEEGPSLGGNNRWSWFESDLAPQGAALIDGFRKTEWDAGYDVRFPAYSRSLSTGYRSLAARDFHAGLERELPADTLRMGCRVEAVDAEGIDLEGGERIEARSVIDCRGISGADGLEGGWQVFLGRYLKTATPHGLERPMVMDAAVAQHGAYRFVYVLPLGAHELLVEDTYYADRPDLDRSALSGRIDRYCEGRGWQGEILGNEAGVLPVITGGDFAGFRRAFAVEGVALAGARGGFVHPLTSYTLPFAVEVALLVAREAELTGRQLAAMMEALARRHWQKTRFYRRLGRMLMGAATPDRRFHVFERFYRLPQPLIERFYAARSTRADRLRILCGKPPVPVGRAIGSLITSGRPLARSVGA